MPPFVVGVNYWPRKKAMYWWQDFSFAEVDAEFAEIASWGCTVVRIFLTWEDFQPAPDRVSPGALDALATVLDVAQAHNLRVMPTFFTGHMSGIGFWPSWALSDEEAEGGDLRLAGGCLTTKKPCNPYEDPFLLAAQADLIRAVCTRFASHPAIWGWDVANEPDNLSVPRSYMAGAAWRMTMSSLIRSYAPQLVTCGFHMGTIAGPYRGFRSDFSGSDEDVQSMHPYSIYYRGTVQSDPLNSDVAPLACLVTEALGGKPVLCQEFGCATSPAGHTSYLKWTGAGPLAGLQYFAEEVSAGHHYQEVLEKLVRCGATGALAWVFSDYDPCLYGTPPFDCFEHERHFGLTRPDGTLKPQGHAFCAMAERAAAGLLPARTVTAPVLDAQEWYRDPEGAFDRFFHAWRGRP